MIHTLVLGLAWAMSIWLLPAYLEKVSYSWHAGRLKAESELSEKSWRENETIN